MSKVRDFLGFIVQAIIAGLALAFVLIYLWPSLAERLAGADGDSATVAAPASYADAVNRAAPAVVSIYSHSLEPRRVDPELQRRLGTRALYQMRQNLASGVLMTQDGYILTNHHVIRNARNIRISLWDGRVAPVSIVGSDPVTDLAVLKVDLEGLPVAPIPENYQLQVGDVVLAIGNALGLTHTVTMGIISATGRDDRRSAITEGFIQTDAAINTGNSGGALINSRGELIGINARNLNFEEGAQNIGFAIPIGLALNVMNQIREYGSVRRGWLGATYSDLRPTQRSDAPVGIAVAQVYQDSPAWNAGIRQGDIILSLDGEPVLDAGQFMLEISRRDPDSQVELEIMRGSEQFQTYATLIQQPPLRLKQ